jgi:branched-chain amino acid transport system permease protein
MALAPASGRLRDYGTIAAVLAALAGLPLFLPVSTANDILVFGLYAMGFNVALGYTGVLSFGHAAYFGLGAYGAGLTLRYTGAPTLAGILAGVLLATAGAAVVGSLCVKKRGVYFAMLTAAFGQMLYFLALSPWKHFTGGEDGLKGIRKLGIDFPFSLDLGNPWRLYGFTLAIVALAILALHRLLRSPFGSLLQGIRENELRLRACGYDTERLKIVAFTASGLFCGLAGALYTVSLGYVPLSSLYWTNSGRAVVMTLLGGMGTFFGPLLGAGIFVTFEDKISVYTPRWEVYVGALVVFLILAFPEGILGTIKQKLADRGARARQVAAEGRLDVG